MSLNVLMISPGFPPEMPFFTRGLARVGARVIGLGDQPAAALPPVAREALADHLQAPLHDERGVIELVRRYHATRARIDRVECLWEPAMILAAKLRQSLGLSGMGVDQTVLFRDKEKMKQVLDAAGVRTPRHASAHSVAEVLDAAAYIGYPLILKPIAGAGSADTYRCDSRPQLDEALRRMGHVPEVSVEEFIEAEDWTFDALCVGGQIKYYNLCLYRPRALIARQNEWISPQTFALRHVDQPELEPGRLMGRLVLQALGFQTGFTHMEWYRKPDGEAVFGEIAARPPGAHTVDLMNFASDIDLYRGWGEVACHGSFSQPVQRRYNAGWVFKRAHGQGRIQRIEGLAPLLAEYGEWIVWVDLLPVGAPRRDWKQTLISDGMVIVRHPDLARCMEIADAVGTRLQIFAA